MGNLRPCGDGVVLSPGDTQPRRERADLAGARFVSACAGGAEPELTGVVPPPSPQLRGSHYRLPFDYSVPICSRICGVESKEIFPSVIAAA